MHSEEVWKLAIEGGEAVRSTTLPYGRQFIDDDDVAAVVEVLRSDWLTTGPTVEAFEEKVAERAGASHAVAVSNGTAALHAAMYAMGIGPGDEVIVPCLTFAASANAVAFQGARPVFADVDPSTLLISYDDVERKISVRTKAIVVVDYAGQPCDYDAIMSLAEKHGVLVVADASHSLGARYRSRCVGNLAHLTTFSFHPVKHVACGEGGMITSNDADFTRRMRRFRNHGISADHRQREETGSWYYEISELGYNYRLSDLQCALGLSQMRKLDWFLARRRAIAKRYDEALTDIESIQPLAVQPDVSHAYHLYVVQLELERLTADRTRIFSALRAEGIGVNVHYVPVHLHPFYRTQFQTEIGACPVAEAAYHRILSVPLFPGMTDEDVESVIHAMRKVVRRFSISSTVPLTS